MPCHYKSVKSFKWSIPNSDVKIDYHKKFSFQSFDFCVNPFVKGTLASFALFQLLWISLKPCKADIESSAKVLKANMAKIEEKDEAGKAIVSILK